MIAPNTTAHSAGAVCCPDAESAVRHDRRGWPSTWLSPSLAEQEGVTDSADAGAVGDGYWRPYRCRTTLWWKRYEPRRWTR